MASPWNIAGALAALYELGILQRVAPGMFTASRDTDTRTGLFAGLAGMGIGTMLNNTENRRLEDALTKERTLRRNAELNAQAWAMAQRHAVQMQQLQAMLGRAKAVSQ